MGIFEKFKFGFKKSASTFTSGLKEINKNKIILGTKSGNLESKILEEKLVETKIGSAKTNWDEIPLVKKLDTINLN